MVYYVKENNNNLIFKYLKDSSNEPNFDLFEMKSDDFFESIKELIDNHYVENLTKELNTMTIYKEENEDTYIFSQLLYDNIEFIKKWRY